MKTTSPQNQPELSASPLPNALPEKQGAGVLDGRDACPTGPPNGGYRLAVRTAVVAGAFSAVVCALLVSDYLRRQPKNPSEDMMFQAVRAALAEQPDNEKLQEAVRQLDLALRQEYFRQRRFAAVGTWLLLGGVIVTLVAARSASTLRRRLPTPSPQAIPEDRETPAMHRARWAVAAVALVLLGVLGLLALSVRSPLSNDTAQLTAVVGPEGTGGQSKGIAVGPGVKTPIAPGSREDSGGVAEPRPTSKPSGEGTSEAPGTTPKVESQPAESAPPEPPAKPFYPSADEIRAGWLRFRGPGGLGIAAVENLPLSWDGPSGKGILWKTPVPLAGNNSPVVVGDFLFLSGADETRREVFSFDANTGKLRWRRAVPGTPESAAEPPKVMEDTGYAAPTVTTNGRWVFAIFANGDVAAYDFGGNLVWARSLGIPENSYGHASSLTLYRDLLLIQFDQGSAKEGKSKLLALEASTGETVYEVPRPVSNSWTTPVVMTHQGRDQLITCSDPWVIAYNPADGTELWRADCMSGDCGPSPAFADGVVHVGNEYCQWSAIRADGQGDVTKTHILWTAEDGLPDLCSPLVTPEYLFLLATFGTLTCYDSKTGELLWEKDLEAGFASSPSWAAGRVYLFSDEGKGFVIEPSREEAGVKVLSETDLGEPCVTSPAFQEGRIYIRGKEHVFCIGG